MRVSFACPYPDCGFVQDYPVEMSKDDLNRALFAHLNRSHPGWTLEEVTAHYQRKQQA